MSHDVAVFSVDLEIRYLLSRNSNKPLGELRKAFFNHLIALLEFLKNNHIRATFFVEGFLATTLPIAVKAVRDYGHEIACHSFSHRPLSKLPTSEIERDLKKAVRVLVELTGDRPLGFRAPRFMTNKRVFGVLDKLGFVYDSSIVPFWIPGRYCYLSAPRKPFSMRPHYNIIEVPVSVLNIVRLPLGLPWINMVGSNVFLTLLKALGTTRPIVFYMHIDDLFGRGLYNLACFVSFLKEFKTKFMTALELTELLEPCCSIGDGPRGGGE